MTNLIIKGHRYRLIDNSSFELPLPLKYVVLKEDNEIAKYEVSADESVSCTILTKYKEDMITPVHRPLTMADVYYFFSSRVFQDKTPYTGYELSQLGLEKYNVYNIIRKTRGITPYDTYWVRFEGDGYDYDTARKHWEKLMSSVDQDNASQGAFAGAQMAPGEPLSGNEQTADVNEILNQKKVDVAAKIEEHAPSADEENPVPQNSTMSAEEIEALLAQANLTDAPAAPEPTPAPAASSGGNLSPDEIAKLFAANDDTPAAVAPEPAPEPTPAPAASSGGNLSPDEIAKLFAANDDAPAASESAPASTPAPAASSGGNLSPDEIAKLFAANDDTPAAESAAEAAPAPTPTPAPAASSGGNLSPDEIAKLFAANDDTPAAESAAEAAPAPAPTPAPAASSGGNLSPDEIAKLFAANDDTPAAESAAEAAPAPEPTPAPAASSGGKMSQEDIEKMLNEQVNAVSEPIDINAPAENANASEPDGERLSPEEIEALLGDMKKDAQT